MVKRYHIIYKIINLINGNIYIGAHTTPNVNDSYMGSGDLIKKAIRKYGKENFKKEIIGSYDTIDEMFKMESIIVNDTFLNRKDVYNIKEGGSGGWDHIQRNPETSEARKKRAGDLFRKLHAEGKIKYNTFTGKKHSEESKIKIGKANSISQSGERNSNYGNVWIHNEKIKKSMRIPKEELNIWLKNDWVLGRKIKW